MSEEKGTPLPGGVGAGITPDLIKSIFGIIKDKGLEQGIGNAISALAGEADYNKAKNHVMLGMDKLSNMEESINPSTVVKYLLCLDKVLVQDASAVPIYSNYLGLLEYPNITKPAFILSNPKLTSDGILFDCDEPVPDSVELDVIASVVEDDNVIQPGNELPYVGSVIKLIFTTKVRKEESTDSDN